MKTDYARAFRIIRAAFGLNQSELAARMEISPSQLSLIEAGKRNPSVGLLSTLAKAVDVPAPLVSLLAASSGDIKGTLGGDISELSALMLKLLAPSKGAAVQTRVKKRA